MAGTKEILCSATADMFPSKSLLSNNFIHQQQNSFSPFTSSFNSCKRRVVQLRKVVAVAAAVPMQTLIELDSTKAIPEIPVQFTVTAQVTVKYDAKENMKEMVFNLLDSGANATQRGVFLQLVSTDVDPSKHRFFHFQITLSLLF